MSENRQRDWEEDEFLEEMGVDLDEYSEVELEEENEEKKKKKNTWPWIILMILIIILLLLFCRSCGSKLSNPDNNGGLQMGIIDMDSLSNPADRETMQRTLNQQVEAGMVSIFMNTDIKVESDKTANWLIQNVKQNSFDMQVTVTDEETGTVLYESPKIQPGYKVENDAILANLSKGKHPCLATFALFDNETGDLVNYIGLKVNVTF